MNRTLILLPTAVAAAFVLAACNPADNRTAGQKVDEAVAGAKAEVNEVKRAVNEAGTNVANAATDAMITTKINAALAADDQLKATRIDVDTRDGRVVLSGLAPDATSRERATTLARAVEGVVHVDNRLTVSPKG
jgi:hyperosmotically inducible periplasmic protein